MTRDYNLEREVHGRDDEAGNHVYVRPIFEVLAMDSYRDQRDIDYCVAAGRFYWMEPADSEYLDIGVCAAIVDTDGNEVFPALVNPADQPCPFPGNNPPPVPPKHLNPNNREFAIAA